jgi:hypothetical protein
MVAAFTGLAELLCMILDKAPGGHRPEQIPLAIADVRAFVDRGRP